MTTPTTLFDRYIDSSLHVAGAVTALTLITGLQLGRTVSFETYIISYTATVVGYNTIKYGRMVKNGFPIRLNRYANLSIFMVGVGLIVSTMLPLLQLITLMGVGVLALFYAFPIQPNLENIRNRRNMKIYWVALVWSLFTVLFPFSDLLGDPEIWLIMAHRFLFVLCATLPFEIRDYPTDPESLQTWPQQFGVTATRRLGIVIVIFASLLSPVTMAREQFAMLITHLFLVILLYKSNSRQTKYFASFWVESLPYLWAILALLA